MKNNTERRKFFKKAGMSAISAGMLSILPFKLFAQSQSQTASKNSRSTDTISIKPNPMAVKRENRK